MFKGAFLKCERLKHTAEELEHIAMKSIDSCCALIVKAGALLAAEDCLEAIPIAWTDHVLKYSEYCETVDKLVAHRVVVSILSY